MKSARFLIVALAALACVSVRYSCHKPAVTKPTTTVTVEKPDTTCRCGKRCCSDTTAWNWYVPVHVHSTGMYCWERDNGKWSWVWYGNPVKESEQLSNRSAQASASSQTDACASGSCASGSCGSSRMRRGR